MVYKSSIFLSLVFFLSIHYYNTTTGYLLCHTYSQKDICETLISPGAGAVVAAAVTIVAVYYYFHVKKPKIPSDWTAVGDVKQLCLFPLKSGKRYEVDQAECTELGLMEVEKADNLMRLRDRSFVVYDEYTLKYTSGGKYPKMMLIEIKVKDANHVILNAPKMKDLLLQIPQRPRAQKIVITYYRNEEVTFLDCGDKAGRWISQYVTGKDMGLRIAYHNGSHKINPINRLYKDRIDYYRRRFLNESTSTNSSLMPMHIITTTSVDEINKQIENADFTTNNFRPNLVVDGPTLKPFEEDDWKWVKIGDVIMKNVEKCTRCVVPAIDPDTAIRRPDYEPLKTMITFRSSGPDKDPAMGILLEVYETGKISIGDTVYVNKK